MSRRNINKVFGKTTLPPPDNSDDEFEPQFARSGGTSVFGELPLSSHSESQQDSPYDKVDKKGTGAIKAQKKKKKKRNKAKHLDGATSAKNTFDEMDEIDRSVMEVNALLGSPPEPTKSAEEPRTDPRLQLMAIQNKFLNSENELRKMMGIDTPAEERKRRQQLHGARSFRRNMIVSFPDKTFNFHGYGLSMSIEKRDGNVTYFTYDHNEQYQKIHRSFLSIIKNTNINLLLSREEIQNSLHVEGMLEVVDSFFAMEEYNQAEVLLEKTLACLQYTTHPNFNFTNPNVRLEYKYLENRPFFTAILKYIYLLSNKSCHRTALELAKLLLNLDPSDPIKMFLIIDIVALRAREHQWLVDVIDTLGGQNNHPDFIVNLKYSYVLARFHVAHKRHESLDELDKLLQETILHCPIVAKSLLDCFSGIPKEHLENHVLFSSLAIKHAGPKLIELTKLYARLISAKWREPNVLKWFLKNVNHLVETFSPEMEAIVVAKSQERSHLFSTWPSDVVRHMTIIKAMSELIADGLVPPVKRASAANPVPPLGSIDRYKYYKSPQQTNRTTMNPIWHDFFASALPRNVNIKGIRPHWLMMQNTPDYVLNADLYLIHIQGTPYMVVPSTLIVFSLYFLLLSVALKELCPEIDGGIRAVRIYLDDNIDLD